MGSDPVPVVEAVKGRQFSVSRTGALVYVPGGEAEAQRSLVWVTRDGREEPLTAAPPRAYAIPRLSPDGTRVALDIRDQQQDIWIWDLARQTLTRLTDAPAGDLIPVWTPDSRRVIFASARAGQPNLFWQAANNTGTAERLTASPNGQAPMSISPDGTRLLVREDGPTTGLDLRVLRLDPFDFAHGGTESPPSTSPGTSPSPSPGTPPRQTEPLLPQTPFEEHNGEISPDGRWLAYQSNASGRDEIFVRPFPNVDAGNWMVSTSGGTPPTVGAERHRAVLSRQRRGDDPRPGSDDANLQRRRRDYAVRDASTSTRATRGYDVSPDGQRFLMIKDAAAAQAPTMVVVLNWLEELKAKLPAPRRGPRRSRLF